MILNQYEPLTICMLAICNFSRFFGILLTFFPKLTFSKNSFRDTIRGSNIHVLDTDHDRGSVGPDLDPNCFQRSSADKKILCYC